MPVLIKNASQILTMSRGFGLLKDSSLLIADGIIERIGRINLPKNSGKVIDASHCIVTPGLVDSHTHLVFGGTREEEFALRLKGVKYEAIARKGGGIMRSVAQSSAASADELFEEGKKRIVDIIKRGTTTVEVKSGYGIMPAEELRILRVIKRLKAWSPIDVIPTYLVHIKPPRLNGREYAIIVKKEIIPAVAKEKLAVFCDIFCDITAFNKIESREILLCAKKFGFKLKIHADELSDSGGARLAAEIGCVSADHLIFTGRSAIRSMKKNGVTPVLLPGTSLYLQNARKPDIGGFLRAGIPTAIASDFNPGTCMIYSMPTIISLACLLYRMPIEAAIAGATVNGARALDLGENTGMIKPGYPADLVIWSVDNYKKIPYQFGENLVKTVFKRGKIIHDANS